MPQRRFHFVWTAVLVYGLLSAPAASAQSPEASAEDGLTAPRPGKSVDADQERGAAIDEAAEAPDDGETPAAAEVPEETGAEGSDPGAVPPDALQAEGGPPPDDVGPSTSADSRASGPDGEVSSLQAPADPVPPPTPGDSGSLATTTPP